MGMHVDCFSSGVCCMCVFVCVCVCAFLSTCASWRRALCGRRECEKLAVLTALEQLQHSVGAGGVCTFGASCSGENRVSGGAYRLRLAKGKGFIPRP